MRTSTSMLLVVVLALASCGYTASPGSPSSHLPSSPDSEDTSSAADTQQNVDSGQGQEDLPLDLVVAPVFDPLLGGPLEITVLQGSADVTVWDEKGGFVASVTDSWDGRTASGEPAPTGRYLVRADGADYMSRDEWDQEWVDLVRCGVTSALAEGDGGKTAFRVPLYWYENEYLQDEAQPFVSLEFMEAPDGSLALFPSPNEDLASLPPGANQPLAFTWDSRPILTLWLGDDGIFGSSGLPGLGIQVQVPGWTVLSGGTDLDPGVPIVIQADEPVSDALGVIDEDLLIGFFLESNGGTVYEIGTQVLPVRWYSTLGATTFDNTGDQYNAWPAFVEPALQALEGLEPDTDSVLSALVEWVFYESDLVYDTTYGASAYSSYRGGWGNATFLGSDFVERRYGDVVNCSDCAGILLTYANMLGARLDYTMVFRNFALNYILAIGIEEFTHCPFGPWGCSFSYHAVNTYDSGENIFDSTLALDGDEDPGTEPCETLLVRKIPGEEYLDRLAMNGNPYFQYEAQGTLQ